MERTELLKDLERSLDQAKKELVGFREWIELGKPIKVVKYKYELADIILIEEKYVDEKTEYVLQYDELNKEEYESGIYIECAECITCNKVIREDDTAYLVDDENYRYQCDDVGCMLMQLSNTVNDLEFRISGLKKIIEREE